MNNISKYAMCALIAIFFNILVRELSLRLYDRLYSIIISVLSGTVIGLIVKYLLDKKYIFKHYVNGLINNGKMLAFYISTGIITTLIFWTFEFSFEYILKYKLDKNLFLVKKIP
jgi:putative flippase GtrA